MFKILALFLFMPLVSFAAPKKVLPGVGGFIENNGKVLLLERSHLEEQFPGYYGLPGGKVDPGETPEAAIVRETKEETGLDVEIIEVYNEWDWHATHHGVPTIFRVTSFRLRVIGPLDIVLSDEHTGYSWVTPEDLEETKLTDPNRADLRKGFTRAFDAKVIKDVVSGFIEVADRVLLLKRSPDEDQFPGYYNLPGGKLNPTDTKADGIIREVKEETGLDVEVIEELNEWAWRADIRGVPTLFRMTTFRLRPVGRIRVQLSHEHTSYSWALPGQLSALKLTAEATIDIHKGFARSEEANCEHVLNPQWKVVRDKMDAIYVEDGDPTETRLASNEELKPYMQTKVMEEFDEFMRTPTEEELGDLMDAVEDLGHHSGINVERAQAVRSEKSEKKGRFRRGLLMKLPKLK